MRVFGTLQGKIAIENDISVGSELGNGMYRGYKTIPPP